MDIFLILDNIAAMSSIPVTLFKDGQVVYQPVKPPYLNELLQLVPERLIASDKQAACACTSDHLFFGMIHAAPNSYVLLGPVSEFDCSTERAYLILKKEKRPLLDATLLKNYFDCTPRFFPNKFIQIIIFTNYLLNSVYIADTSDVALDGTLYPAMDLPDPTSGTTINTLHVHADYEQILFSYVKHGMVNKLHQLLRKSTFEGTPGKLSENTLRSIKNLIIINIALAERAAVAGGLDYEIALNLGDSYIRELENTTEIDQLKLLKDTFMMTITRLVADTRVGAENTAINNKVAKYIRQNLGSRITIKDIASNLRVSTGYLCVQFKKDCGMTVNDYILRTKVNEAQEMLASADKPIAQIAYQLGFSSQSYFQTVFKRVTGITPKKYRDNEHQC